MRLAVVAAALAVMAQPLAAHPVSTHPLAANEVLLPANSESDSDPDIETRALIGVDFALAPR